MTLKQYFVNINACFLSTYRVRTERDVFSAKNCVMNTSETKASFFMKHVIEKVRFKCCIQNFYKHIVVLIKITKVVFPPEVPQMTMFKPSFMTQLLSSQNIYIHGFFVLKISHA